MTKRITIFLSLLLLCFNFQAQTFDELAPDTTATLSEKEIPIYNAAEVQARLQQLGIMITPEYNASVEAYIKTYVLRHREKTAKILGKSVIYFPLFEKMLKENSMPVELKYLAVIESALNPAARSRVGAMGLWQFMPQTGKEYGMLQTELVDERRDPRKSTAGAIAYLKDAYRRYNDWALAIASYNSGPGRVNSAIKRARSNNFWKIARFLPKETRSYVPGFIAAAYMMNNYHHHDLKPEMPSLDLQMTESTLVFQSLSFFTVAQVTGLALDVIQELNPAYTKEIIPQNINGYMLTLPKRVMTAMRDYLNLGVPDAEHSLALESVPVLVTSPPMSLPALYVRSVYTAEKGDKLEDLAEMFGCTAHCIKAWNNLRNAYLDAGQELVLYQPREYKRFLLSNADEKIEAPPTAAPHGPATTMRKPKEIHKVPQSIPTPELKNLEIKNETPGTAVNLPIPLKPDEPDDLFFMYKVKNGESLLNVAEKFPGNTTEELKNLNNIGSKNPFKAGMKLKVRKPSGNFRPVVH